MVKEPSDYPSAGWYQAKGDAPGTQRYWDGENWRGAARPIPENAKNSIVGFGARLAEVQDRFAARFIDWVIWAVIYLASSAMFRLGFVKFEPNVEAALVGLVALAFICAFEAHYLVRRKGSTPGMALMGIRVVLVNDPTVQIGATQAFKRMAYLVCLVTLSSLVGLVWSRTIGVAIFAVFGSLLIIDAIRRILRTPNEQTLWDKYGGTLVVEML